MSVLGTVLKPDVDITPYLNPKLSDIVMEEMLQVELDKRRKNGIESYQVNCLNQKRSCEKECIRWVE